MVATVWRADQKYFILLQKETGKCNDFWNDKKKDWFSYETRVAFVCGEVCKGASKNSATFKMELSGTISNSRKLQRALSDGLTTNGFLKFSKYLSCQNTHMLDSTMLFTQYFKNTWLSARISKFPATFTG